MAVLTSPKVASFGNYNSQVLITGQRAHRPRVERHSEDWYPKTSFAEACWLFKLIISHGWRSRPCHPRMRSEWAASLSATSLRGTKQTIPSPCSRSTWLPAAKVPGPHSHDGYEETAYGLEGILTFTVEGKVTEVGPGRVLVIPRGAVHRFDNFHSATATLLTVITPGILGPSYFREVADLLRASAGGPPDLAYLGQIMRRHGLTPAT